MIIECVDYSEILWPRRIASALLSANVSALTITAKFHILGGDSSSRVHSDLSVEKLINTLLQKRQFRSVVQAASHAAARLTI